MNDTMSLLLATSILAVGGIGLYMYKSSNDEDESDDNYIFEKDNFWGLDDSNNEDKEEEEEEEEIPKPRKSKTKRKKTSGGTKRRY